MTRYQGRSYEVAFHDYTQFSEVYDTTFDIELTKDGQRWLDDFGLKGPSPRNNPVSWDRSPVANGAHYFLYGKIESENPGVLDESGFGVVFPNYIVDVKEEDGQYTEAIQFQCLERGGVRVFEGINFLSRKPFLTDEEMEGMHLRAKKAGMYPYGASPEQMHYVEHTDPADWNPVDNDMQGFWTAIGTEKLLSLVESSTHSTAELDAVDATAVQ
uniref:Uncharacterized protein n=1 Tax=Eutreptiella gymnastica TaxID=73025 RepID=A0A7S1J7N7_9EUGL